MIVVLVGGRGGRYQGRCVSQWRQAGDKGWGGGLRAAGGSAADGAVRGSRNARHDVPRRRRARHACTADTTGTFARSVPLYVNHNFRVCYFVRLFPNV